MAVLKPRRRAAVLLATLLFAGTPPANSAAVSHALARAAPAPSLQSAEPIQTPAASPVPPSSAVLTPSPAGSPESAPPVAATASAHRSIATSVPAAQVAFDRGLVMLYAFNVGEARAAFRAVEAADPHAVMGYVGEAIAETIDINRPTTADGERRGTDAAQRGRRAVTATTPADETALLAAVEARYARLTSQDARFTAYARALQSIADANPGDATDLTLAAYAQWNATGRLTGAGDALTADARTIGADLDAALALDPADVGARHLRVHFWEEAAQPQRAAADADYLARLHYEPGESHLEHMAGHIYDRLGDYAAMVRVNLGACANDDAYFARGSGDGQAYMRTYHAHDVDFVLYGLTTVGRDAEARAFAARDSAFNREIVALRLHDARTVLRELGDAIVPMRVIAEARAGDVDAARADLARLPHATGAGEIDEDIATAAVARAAHDRAAAVAAYRKAVAATGDELGDPKVRWWTPAGEGLGVTLLEAGQAAEAESAFRAELVRYPNDPRLEFGLAAALAAQNKDDSAAGAAYRAGWQGERPLSLADLG